MNKPVTVKTERVDDIPLLFAQLKRMRVQELLDEHIQTHGNWQGLSLGNVAVVWLSHILSQADHRLNHVQPWLENHLETVRECSDFSRDLFFNKAIAKPPIPQGLFSRYRLSLSENYCK